MKTRATASSNKDHDERSLAIAKAKLAGDVKRAMARHGFNISSLARRMRASRNKLSRLLTKPDGSMNLRSLVRLAMALEATVVVRLGPARKKQS